MNTLFKFNWCLVLLCCTLVNCGLYTDIYRQLDAQACVRLLDKNGPIGCNTPEGGVVGDLFIIETQEGINKFAIDPPSDPKAVALPASLFNYKSTLNNLYLSGKLAGVLLLDDGPNAAERTPDITFPNYQWGLKTSSIDWNPQGEGLNFMNLPVPIYALSKEESKKILLLATNDTSYPRQAIQFHTFMDATTNAKTCLRRQMCQPLGGKSVWSAFNTVGKRPIVLAMANMDSSALFHELATGADSTASGIVGLLGAAMALAKVNNNQTKFVNDIVFSFWSGESWGYLGSRKFLDDIQNFKCTDYDSSANKCNRPYKEDLEFQNIKLSNIVTAIEVNQIGLISTTNPTLYIHQQNQNADPLTNMLVNVSQSSTLATQLKPVTNTGSQAGIPPSSLMSFLMANPNLPGVVITDHDADYANRNFHSHFDTLAINNISRSGLCDAATLLARTLYLLAINQTSSPVLSTIQAPCDDINVLVDCLAGNFSCDLITQVLRRSLPPTPSYYTGIFGWTMMSQLANPIAVFIHNFMSIVTSYNKPTNCSNGCTATQQCIADLCVDSETHFHDAISLGFEWDYSNNMWTIVDETQPLYVESNWNTIGVELFLRDNPSSEALFLTAGIIEFVISLVAVFYAKRYFLKNYKIF